jgi:methionyl-tRNA formyltransferase
MAGDKVTGVTTMLMDTGLDTGDIILQKPVDIDEDMDHGELEALLAGAGADLLIDTVAVLASGSFPRRKQDNHRSSYAPMLTREEEKIDWQDTAINIRNRIRALSPQPAAYTSFRENRFKIFKGRLVNQEAAGVSGMVMAITPQGFQVQTGQGILEVLEVQKQGKKRIASSELLKGFALAAGDILA